MFSWWIGSCEAAPFVSASPVEAIVEDGAHRAIGPGPDLQRSGASGIDPVAAEALVKADNSEAGAKALLGMRPVGKDALAQQVDIRPHG